MNRLRPSSIRFRITALATLLAGALLTVTAVSLVVLQQQQLTANFDNSLGQLADTYEATFAADARSDALAQTFDDDRAIQLVSEDGTVLLASPNIEGHPPLRPQASQTGQSMARTALPLLDDDDYRILSRPIMSSQGPALLHVAENVDDLNGAVRALAIALAVAVPAVIALLGGLTWWLVGRTLRPVEQIRNQVAEISGTVLDRRVPVPDQNDEIARLAVTMNQMLDRIDTSSRRQRQFVADASHELRTPLTRIRTEVEVDLNQPETADAPATARTVLEEAIGLQELLDDLLFLAREDEGQTTLLTAPLDLDDIVRREAIELRAASSSAAEPLTIETTGIGPAHLVADGTQLTRVVRNLLSNAERHASSTVAVVLTEDDEAVQLSVADDGPGVPAALREQIFERFVRVDDARARSLGGAGLGLAIVRDIVRRHGGTITCSESQLGGALFLVALPKKAPSAS